ncbi:MAG: 2Fe-2S iron-sulfur cluster-binding protein, partial [Pseudomonadota bacterium]
MSFQISIEDSGETFNCRVDQNVLSAMERLGHKGIPVGCRGGGCGICRVQVVGEVKHETHYRTLKMSKAQVSDEDRENGIALAC